MDFIDFRLSLFLFFSDTASCWVY